MIDFLELWLRISVLLMFAGYYTHRAVLAWRRKRLQRGPKTTIIAGPTDLWVAPPQAGTCDRPPEGWYCSREKDHEGPCPTWPSDGTWHLLGHTKNIEVERDDDRPQ